MPDNSKITLKQLKDAMNMVKEYVDAEIRAIGDNNNIPCTGIVLNKNTLSFATTATQTLVATVTPTNCTQSFTWSVSPSGIVTVNNGVVTPIANGSCTIIATCGSHSATCAVTVSGITVSTVLYELKQAKTFNGTSDYIDTGVTLLSTDNLDKDWTMLIDFTPTKLSQCSIIHCMTEVSPWPGMYLSLMTTGAIQMVFPNNSANNNIVTATANQRYKFVIKKVGNTFTVYDSTMSSLHTATTSTITTTDNTLLVGAIQVYNTTQHTMTYSRFFKGTIHRFKIVEGNMSDEYCLSWTTDSPTDDNYTLLCGNLDYTGRGNGPIMGTGEDIVPMVFRRDFDTSNHTTLCSNKTIKRICLRIDKAGKLTIGKADLTQHGKNTNVTIIDPVEYDVIVGLNELDVNISCGAHESLAIAAVGDTGLPLFSYTALTAEQVQGFPIQTNKDFKAGVNPTNNVALLGAIYI